MSRSRKKIFRFFKDPVKVIQNQFIAGPSRPFSLKESLVSNVLRGLPIIGYFMATMSIFDCIFVVIPPQLQNPAWELASLGSIANHTWGILIGFGFMLTTFSRDTVDKVKPIEIIIINFFRFVIILIALIFILAVPLTIINTFRVNNTEAQQINNQVKAQQQVITQVEQNLDSITDARQLLEIVRGLNLNIAYTPQSTTDSLKQEIQDKLPGAKEKLKREANMTIGSKKKYQWKASIRTLIQLFIFSITNILLWFKTRKLNTLIG